MYREVANNNVNIKEWTSKKQNEIIWLRKETNSKLLWTW